MRRLPVNTVLVLACVTLLLACGCKSSSVAVRANENGQAERANFEAAESRADASATSHGEARATVEKPLLPAPKGYVNDFADVLDDETKQRMESKLTKLEKRSGVQLAVATIETTDGQPLFDYSLQVAREWGVGHTGKAGGMLLMVAVKDRQWRIQVTRSLEADIPNEEAARLGQLMVPDFRAGNYGGGVMKCVDGTIAHLEARKGFKLDQ